MFATLKNLFQKNPPQPSADPELVDLLVEIASPSIKLARKYQERLSPYVYWAEGHAAQFTAQWPQPVTLSVENWRHDRLLQLLFATPSRMGELIGENPLLHQWFGNNPFVDTACLVFTADVKQKMRYGMVEEGGQIRQDVPQQVLQFAGYRVGKPAESASALINAGPRRILEIVAAQANINIERLEAEKAALDSELLNARTMLRMAQANTPEYTHQQSRINTLTEQLQALNISRGPDQLCELLITELAATPDILTLEKESFMVDSMGIIGSNMGDEQSVEISEIVLQSQDPIRKLLMIFEVPRSLLQTPSKPTTFTGEARF
ncbi:hypothetical protein HQ393_14200 [Chitinibacter bivalviorum]|uniref:Uncharacterized protein n=1 Tax=Chitinibacter bivalviorum TaxID=2739434 RepID=A0A7H9BPM5_9NEIS|nr:hypothetical protein [Chitinibacter bivalviorum]QLG89304.1 hypothetical protein HQ393_14200 [Chitinibacter bivalviorum]